MQSVTAGTATVNGQIRLVVTDGNGTRNVDATVLGLKSAAYTESSAYATSAQGTLADNAVRSITADTAADNGKIRLVVNTGGTTANVDVTVTGLGSAAYTASSNYATAAQGTLATNAVRSVSAAATTTAGRIALTVNQGGTSTTTNIDVPKVVKTEGDQTVGGAKTFSDGVTFSGASFNYTGMENATADADRNIWFSDSSMRGKPTYNDNFKYNPAQRKLTLGGGAITYDAATDTFTV